MWTSMKAPSLAEMETIAHEIFERLPRTFRKLCEGVIIRVDDFPTDEVLDELQVESEFDLLGLFQGVGLPFRSNDDIARLPNMIWLYRRPILDYWAEHEETLGHIVRHVLIQKSATISASPTPIWRRLRPKQSRIAQIGLLPGPYS